MRSFRRGLVAALLISLPGASALAQTSVGAGCVGSVDNNTGTFTSRAAGGCDTPAPSTQSSGPSFTPAQQMQLDAAHDVGAAIGSAFVNWLLEPAPYSDPQSRQRAVQQARQRYFGAQNRRQEESLRMQREHEEVLGEMKGPGVTQELAAKDLGNVGALNGEDARKLESLKNQVRALDCAMADAYQATNKLGPAGAAFAEALNRDVLDLETALPKAAAHSGKNVYDVGTFTRHYTGADGSSESQMLANAGISRNAETGETTIVVDYHAGKSPDAKASGWRRVTSAFSGKSKAKEGQTVILLDRDGNVECQQLSAAAAECMKRHNPAYGAAEYCPKPPVEPTKP